MGWVMRSEHEPNRIEVLAQVDDERLSVQNGANMLAITKRQMFHLLNIASIPAANNAAGISTLINLLRIIRLRPSYGIPWFCRSEKQKPPC
jgi:hypothetical protein